MRSRARRVLWNDDARRPRLPWRIAALALTIVLLGYLGTLVFAAATSGSIRAVLGPIASTEQSAVAIRNVASLAAQTLVIAGAVVLVGRFVDRRRLRDFGLRTDRAWWLDLGFGLALGALLMTLVFLFELSVGWVAVRDRFVVARAGFAFWPWFAWGLLTFVAVGVYEELLFRGYLLTNLAEGFRWFDRIGPVGGVGLATVATSLLFGVAHAANPNAGVASVLGIVLGAVMLAAGYVLTGELAIPIGLHITWNFFQGVVYGFPVSGTGGGVSLIAIEQSGPRSFTGGAFGPEAGLVGVGAILLGTALTAGWVQWRYGRLEIDASVAESELRGAQTDGDAPAE
ncbi:CPBP family intramembrane glutamic endopeptidase [Halobellus sp. EA9]|uniref:CPBP family intramembrane glutamic endopeptidase n=1 Tax=Halobellus sp. EA9 TaxID=3421647 RepID=UPI003EBCA720